jgi:hypothetical protein
LSAAYLFFGALVYGVYALFAVSLATGLIVIGASAVLTFVLNLLRGIAFAASDAAARRANRHVEDVKPAAFVDPRTASDHELMLTVMKPMLSDLAEKVSAFRMAGMPKSKALEIALAPTREMSPQAAEYVKAAVDHVYRMSSDDVKMLATEAYRKGLL